MQHGLDGILLVPGLDGRFNAGSHQAMGYLFEGRSNRDTIDVNKLPAELEDAVALVTPSAVLLYTPTTGLPEQLADLLLPVLSSLRTFHATDAEANDSDALEENKLGCFVQMLRGCKRLGIPCRLAPPAKGSAAFARVPSAVVSANGHAALPLLGGGQLVELERWPLLQAYGLEGVGRSGFFTMNFEVGYRWATDAHELRENCGLRATRPHVPPTSATHTLSLERICELTRLCGGVGRGPACLPSNRLTSTGTRGSEGWTPCACLRTGTQLFTDPSNLHGSQSPSK